MIRMLWNKPAQLLWHSLHSDNRPSGRFLAALRLSKYVKLLDPSFQHELSFQLTYGHVWLLQLLFALRHFNQMTG